MACKVLSLSDCGTAACDAKADAGADADASAGDDGGSDVASPMQSATGNTLFDASSCSWVLQGQTVTILGSTCQSIMNGDVLDVRVVAGCPTVIR